MVATTNSLKINVVTIPEEGLNVVISEDGAWFKKCFPEDEKLDFDLGRVDLNCLITKAGDTIFIKGKLSAIIVTCCSRCLESINFPIGADVCYTLIPGKAEEKDDLELTEEDLEIGLYQGDVIDLTPIVCEQIILQIPIKALCGENCKGLCPHCGTDLNVAPCNCRENFVDSRMAVLKDFKIGNH